jgi:hypothetical protein
VNCHVVNYRQALVGGLFICLIVSSLQGQTTNPTKAAQGKAIPRTPDGHPDLQGVWTNATITPLERPADLAGKATLSDSEAKAWEGKDLGSNTLDSDVDSGFNRATGGPGVGAYNNLFVDRGSQMARVDGVKRTSLIVDPPDGKLPPRKAPPVTRRGAGSYDDVKDRPLSERCIIGFGSTAGPPMLPVLYNNNYQIVQTPDSVMIVVEMVHDARIIRMNGKHPPQDVRQMLGDSIGHWENDTLVVETTNFDPRTAFRGASPNLRVLERFRRVDSNNILYRVTVDDPSTFARPFTLEYPFVATAGPVYEYGCHEGNYAMPDILGGARKLEREGRQ